MSKVPLVEIKKVTESIQKNIGLKIALALIVPTITIFLMMYLWITTTHLVFMFVGLTLVIVQVSSFGYYSLTSILSEYEERKKKLLR